MDVIPRFLHLRLDVEQPPWEVILASLECVLAQMLLVITIQEGERGHRAVPGEYSPGPGLYREIAHAKGDKGA